MGITSGKFPLRNQEYYRQRYDTVAPEWDQTLARLGQNDMYEQMFIDLQKRSWLPNRRDTHRILDVGIGSGALSLGLLKTIHRTVHITGIDISSAMLANAKSNLNAVGVYPELRQESIEQTILSQPTFDLVMSAHVLEHFDDPKPALQKMVSLLRPGGKLLTLITKNNLLGQWIHFKWGIHLTKPDQLIQSLADVNLTYISTIPIMSPRLGQQSSIAIIAVKSDG